MRWTMCSQRTLYRDRWLGLRVADVLLPNGRHLDHRIVDCPDGAYAAMVQHEQILLIWRHRFICDRWAWEIPGGMVDPGEKPIDAAAREAEEETGWRPGPLRPLINVQPMAGLVNAGHHIFQADCASFQGPPPHDWESERVSWVPLAQARQLVARGEVVEGATLLALALLFAQG